MIQKSKAYRKFATAGTLEKFILFSAVAMIMGGVEEIVYSTSAYIQAETIRVVTIV